MATGTRRKLSITAETQAQLQLWSRQRGAPHALVQRVRIVLDAAAGEACIRIAERHGVTPQTVSKWVRRFDEFGLESLRDAPRSGGPKQIDSAAIEHVMLAALREAPPNGMYWTTRSLARHLGMSQSAVSRIWRRNGILPRRQSALMPSADETLSGRVSEIAGVYISGGTRVLALVASVARQGGASGAGPVPAHRSFIEQLDGLISASDRLTPNIPGRARQTGVRSLLTFLRGLDSRVSAEYEIHLLLASAGVERKHSIALWLMRHPRFRLRALSGPVAWRMELRHWSMLIAERHGASAVTQLQHLLQALQRHDFSSRQAASVFSWIRPSLAHRLRGGV